MENRADMYKVFVMAVLYIFTTACAGWSFKTPQAGFDEGGYRTSSELDASSIIKYETYPEIEDVEFVVLIAYSSEGNEAYNTFIKSSLQRMGFKSVITELEFINLIKGRGLESTIGNVYDWNQLDNMHALSSQFPRYLVIESLLTNGDRSVLHLNRLRVIDPRASKMLVEFSEVDTLFWDVDREFAYVTVNFLHDWYMDSLSIADPEY
jgi:hypothetical protein